MIISAEVDSDPSSRTHCRSDDNLKEEREISCVLSGEIGISRSPYRVLDETKLPIISSWKQRGKPQRIVEEAHCQLYDDGHDIADYHGRSKVARFHALYYSNISVRVRT